MHLALAGPAVMIHIIWMTHIEGLPMLCAGPDVMSIYTVMVHTEGWM